MWNALRTNVIRKPNIPKWLIAAMAIMIPLSWVPLALIAYYRTVPHRKPRIHFFQDMDNQVKYKAQAANTLFADGRAMRPPIEGTIARGRLMADEHLEHGGPIVEGKVQWADGYPATIKVDEAFILRGQERYNIYCTPCHGAAGYGDGMVHQRAVQLESSAWVQPTNLHTDDLRGRKLGDLYGTIKWGRRTMPGYASKIPTDDRWAIVAYVKALQLSQNAVAADVPEDMRPRLRQE